MLTLKTHRVKQLALGFLDFLRLANGSGFLQAGDLEYWVSTGLCIVFNISTFIKLFTNNILHK